MSAEMNVVLLPESRSMDNIKTSQETLRAPQLAFFGFMVYRFPFFETKSTDCDSMMGFQYCLMPIVSGCG